MLSLEFEIVIILTLFAIVGFLLGRFLCKSGEIEERQAKEELSKSLELTQLELQKSHTIQQELKDTISNHEQKVSNLEQDIANNNTQMLSLNSQKSQLLDNLRQLEKYEARFKALSNEFNLQANAMDELKKDKSLTIQKLDESNTFNTILKQKLSELQTRSDKIKANNDILSEKLIMLSNADKNAKVLKDKIDQLNTALNTKNSQYDTLHSKYTVLSSEYKNYKDAITQNDDRLVFLENEYQKSSEILEEITAQRDDLLARIRAISSVVDAVGVEH
ncbi:MAG: hypothetical protein U9N49_11140 [Campylobacterota bacterium]|nr:hypothetical protein [Campylobacterota bacterium]